MKGPDYPFFDLLTGYLSSKFCDRCGAKYCQVLPTSEKCPHQEKWLSIFNDFDQLVSRVVEQKEAPK